MQPVRGEKLCIFAFEGDRIAIKTQVDEWMAGPGKLHEVVDIHYNYQGPEYVGHLQITDGLHGVLIVARQLTTEEVSHAAEANQEADLDGPHQGQNCSYPCEHDKARS